MTRDPAACLADMLDYARDAQAFAADRKTQFAVLRALEVIGEAAKRVPPEVQDRFPEIPWRQIIGMRNVIAHDDLGIRLSRVSRRSLAGSPPTSTSASLARASMRARSAARRSQRPSTRRR